MAGLQLMKNRFITRIIQVYIEIIRNTPFLVQLFFVYFGLPTLGIRIPAWQAALIALTINIGAYATEIVRAGIESISKGQIEAGRSLGLSGFQIFYIRHPQAGIDDSVPCPYQPVHSHYFELSGDLSHIGAGIVLSGQVSRSREHFGILKYISLSPSFTW